VLGRDLPGVQRGLHGDGRRRLGAVPRCAKEALRLGRILAELTPNEAEVHGLVRADGDSGVAPARARGRTRRASRFLHARTRTARLWDRAAHQARDRRNRGAPNGLGRRSRSVSSCRHRFAACPTRERSKAGPGPTGPRIVFAVRRCIGAGVAVAWWSISIARGPPFGMAAGAAGRTRRRSMSLREINQALANLPLAAERPRRSARQAWAAR